MKKFILLLVCAMAIFATSCDSNSSYLVKNSTSYTFYNVKTYEYWGSDEISDKELGNIYANSYSDEVSASVLAGSVRVSMVVGGTRYYTKNFKLKSGENSIITITENTQVSTSSSKSGETESVALSSICKALEE